MGTVLMSLFRHQNRLHVMFNQLSPSPLGKAAWAEHALQTAVRIGTLSYS